MKRVAKGKRKQPSKSGKSFKIIIAVFAIVGVAASFYAFDVYRKIWWPNIETNGSANFLYIKTDATFEDVVVSLNQKGWLKNEPSFRWLAEKKNYVNAVKPGKYRIRNNMTNNELVNLLRAGLQEPIQVTFNNIRTLEDLAGRVGRQIEADSTTLMNYFTSSETTRRYGFAKERFMCLFIPNTYEFYWNTSAEKFTDRMAEQFKLFWTAERIAKAHDLNLTQSEVSILASIVQGETRQSDEMPKVAGLYLNRLRKGMLLQADPTVVFAVKDFTIKRVLKKHLEFDSPYNTYLYKGLPPGPISIPSIRAMDAVLNAQNHDFIYMCGKLDGSGYHDFSETFSQHQAYATRYRKKLNEKKIFN